MFLDINIISNMQICPFKLYKNCNAKLYYESMFHDNPTILSLSPSQFFWSKSTISPCERFKSIPLVNDKNYIILLHVLHDPFKS
jgi:hypothetical protein